jgi:hypothetical protein
MILQDTTARRHAAREPEAITRAGNVPSGNVQQ